MDIKIYGTDTSGHQLVKSLISELLLKAEIPFNISEVNDVSKFLAKGIDSIPAIQMNSQPIVGLKSNGSFRKALRAAVNEILASQNYGALAKVIIPVNFSEAAINALSFGHRLATDLKAVTKILHVHNPHAQPKNGLTPLCYEGSKTKLKQLADTMDRDWGSDILKASFVSSELKVGIPTSTIAESIANDKATLVIMGTPTEYTINMRSLIIIEVIKVAKSSVMIVPQHVHYKGIHRVALFLDDDMINSDELEYLTTFLAPFNATIHLVSSATRGLKSDFPKITLPQVAQESTICACRNPADGLNQYAADNQIDLVVLLSRNSLAIRYPFSQSNTPVLILK